MKWGGVQEESSPPQVGAAEPAGEGYVQGRTRLQESLHALFWELWTQPKAHQLRTGEGEERPLTLAALPWWVAPGLQ